MQPHDVHYTRRRRSHLIEVVMSPRIACRVTDFPSLSAVFRAITASTDRSPHCCIVLAHPATCDTNF
jgi:hypothetical protein